MASIEELYKKSDFAKLPLKKDRTPISAKDFDVSSLSVTNEELILARGGVLGSGASGLTPEKKYSDTIRR